MSLRLINETEENVIDASPDGGAQVQELSIYPVKSRLEEISFPGIFRIEQFKEIEDESLIDVAFGERGIEFGTFDKSEEEFIYNLEVWPCEL